VVPLIGSDGAIVFDEHGNFFTKNNFHVAVDGKPALESDHRLIPKLSQKKVVRKKAMQKK